MSLFYDTLDKDTNFDFKRRKKAFKDVPDIVKIEKQAKRIAPQVFVEDNELKGETTEEVAVNA